MRVLISKENKKILFDFLKKENNCNSLLELSKKLNVSKSRLDKYCYSNCYLPINLIPQELYSSIVFLDKKTDNWGSVKGGRKTYKIIKGKYGDDEIIRRQKKGIKNSSIIRKQKESSFIIDFENVKFLELYGALLGDGWLSIINHKEKKFYLVGLSGNLSKDKEYFIYLKKLIKDLLKREAYLKLRPKNNSVEINLGHKILIQKLNTQLGFPIGKKVNLQISNKIYNLEFNKTKYVIKGILDTDGCVYFDKTPAGKPYPCISISLKSPILIRQISSILLNQGYKVIHYMNKTGVEQLKLKGTKQLSKWINEIGSSNSRNLKNFALVAQSG
ncbi:MAG TPA: hypothetical protein P5277_03370 [Candidatus Paceibacterota bacterium]|nr:hypothetical protein [Candidatus Paceibacterota bacterium]